MLFLKTVVAPFFYPLPISLLMLMTGLFMLWFTSKQKIGKILVTIGVFIISILGYGLSDNILKILEYQYPSYDQVNNDSESPPSFVVVLAGGHVTDPNIPTTSQISSPSLTRLIEGIRIHRTIPDSRLILSGKGAGSVTEAETMAKIALFLGTDQNQIILEKESDNTIEQAVQLRNIIGDKKFILVTSAIHMPRSMELFRKQGMNPIPAPTEHRISESQKWWSGEIFPSADGIIKAERAIHEYMGIAWLKLNPDKYNQEIFLSELDTEKCKKEVVISAMNKGKSKQGNTASALNPKKSKQGNTLSSRKFKR